MAIDWDTELLGPVMAAFGEGDSITPSSWPTYTPAGGAAFQLPHAVFDAQYQLVQDLGDGSQQTSTHPVLGVRRSLFTRAPAQRDTVFIPSAGKTFRVVDTQPDSHGHVLLILMETGQ